MKVIIVGLGRLGRGLAVKLCKSGHQVTAIDCNPEALERLGENFNGVKIVGVGFDHDVLEKAKIQQVDAVVSSTTSDEANIVIARIAKSIYRVPRVVARLYDVKKAGTYRRLGIQTVSTTTWGIERTTELLTYHHLDSVCDIGNGGIQLVRVDVPALLAGHTVREITAVGEIKVVGVARHNNTFIPTTGTVLEDGDILYAAVAAGAAGKLKSMLGMTA